MLDGKDLRAKHGFACEDADLPLMQRKKILRRIVPRGAERLMYLDHVVGRGVDLFRTICEHDLEGIVAKRRDGVYDPHATTWLKVKFRDYSQARDRHELFAQGRRIAAARR